MEIQSIWFKAETFQEIPKRGMLFTGPSPFDVDKQSEGYNNLFKIPILISHPKAQKNTFYRIKGIESFALPWIAKGNPIGLLVEIWEGDLKLAEPARSLLP